MNILEEALKVTEQRQTSYDKPEDNFQRIADFWTVYFKSTSRDVVVTKKDVALMMVLMKIAREVWKHKMDNLVDGVGYLHCLAKIESKIDPENPDQPQTS